MLLLEWGQDTFMLALSFAQNLDLHVYLSFEQTNVSARQQTRIHKSLFFQLLLQRKMMKSS